MILFLQVFLGILYANLLEYCVHRYLFHGFGKSGSSVFAFHLRTHHSIARSNGFLDDRVSHNELLGLPIVVLFHSPFLVVCPAFFYAITAYAFLFIVVHNVVHRYPLFAQRYYWWHWNHHMRNQNKSWGVVLPITDILTGTLEDNRKKVRVEKR
jgi:hypothetical protein